MTMQNLGILYHQKTAQIPLNSRQARTHSTRHLSSNLPTYRDRTVTFDKDITDQTQSRCLYVSYVLARRMQFLLREGKC